MRKIIFAIIAIGISFFVLLVNSESSFGQNTISTTITYGGFQACGGCAVCGADYWCFNTNPSYCGPTAACGTKSFFDPVPSGNLVTNIQVQYYTGNCAGGSLTATIDGNVVPAVNEGSTGCLCSSNPCGVSASTSGNFPCGMPGYVYGGNNTLQLCTGVSVCINKVVLIITYVTPQQITPSITASGPLTFCQGGSVVLDAGAGYSAYSWSTGAVSQTITVTTSGTYWVTVTSITGCTTGTSAAIAVTVNSNPTPAIVPSGSTTFCAGGSVTLDAGAGYSGYSWSDGSTSQTTTAATSGTWVATVTNANGCQGSASINVTALALPSVTALGTPAGCKVNNGTAMANPSGGTPNYTYVWSNGNTSALISNLTSQIYSVTVTDANGCTAQTSVAIGTTASPAVSVLGTPTGCTVNNGMAAAAASGGIPPYTYLWSNGSTTAQISNLTSQIYSVTVTDVNGCTAAAALTIPVTNAPTATTSVTGNVSCNGGSNGSATTNPSGGFPSYTYLWNNGNTNQTATGLFAGTYTVIIKDANGCSVANAVTITSPPAMVLSVSQNNVLCNGGNNGTASVTAAGGSAPYSYLWSSGATTTQISNLSSQIYSVTVTDAKGCTSIQTVTITQPALLAATVSSVAVFCNGGNNGTASASPSGGASPYTYLWNIVPVQTNAAVTGLSAGNYSVTIADANGCKNNFSVIVTQPAPLLLSVSGNDTICTGENTALSSSASGGNPGYSYSWMPGNQTGSPLTVHPSATTSYTTTVTDSKGCKKNSVTTVLVHPNPTAVASASSTFIYLGHQTTLTATTSTGNYSWSPGTGLSCTTCANPVLNPTNTGSTTYTLTTTDANGCTAYGTVTISVEIDCGEIFVPSAFSPNGDGKNDFATVRGICIRTIDFKIYNRWGQVVFTTEDPAITTNPSKGWDGTKDGKIFDTSVFYYILNYVLLSGETGTKKGNVSLVR